MYVWKVQCNQLHVVGDQRLTPNITERKEDYKIENVDSNFSETFSVTITLTNSYG